MTYRNEKCAMGSYSGGHEYEWREASAAKIHNAKNVLLASLVEKGVSRTPDPFVRR
jgi:hypothetical protein